MKIVIVDDHEAMRRILKSIILIYTKEPIEFIEYDNGEDAVTNYMMDQPKYVLMDIEMKGIDGFEASQLIYDQDSEAKIIIVTSYNSEVFRNRANKIPVQDFITKDKLSDIGKYFK